MSKGYTRREFIGTLGKGTLVLAASGALGSFLDACSVGTSKSDVHQYSIDDVRNGKVSPKDYLTTFEQSPEATEAKNLGMLKGFLYDPSDNELKDAFRETLRPIANGQYPLEDMVVAYLNSYRSNSKPELASVEPTLYEIFGKGLTPMYVIFDKALVSSPIINKDDDIRSLMLHELRHVRDWFGGINLGDIHLSFNDITSSRLTRHFTDYLLELRAYYTELEDAYKGRIQAGKYPISSAMMGTTAGHYFTNQIAMQKYPVTPFENEVRTRQLKEFEGIVPVGTIDDFELKINLFGYGDSIPIKRSK